MRTLTDERGLIAAAQAGDERAFGALVDPYRRVIEVHCYRMLGSLHDAEDVSQETLLRAWRSIERFERRSTVHTWLYRIATNACLDELERRPRRPEPVVDPYPDERLADAGAPIADPAARYALREGMQLAFLTAIQRLPGRQRAMLIVRDVLGWSAAEAAELLDTTVAASNSALQRARATIEQELPARIPTPQRALERDLLNRYVAAWEEADIDSLIALLREDAVITMPPERSIAGARPIGEFFARVIARGGLEPARGVWVNGAPALLIPNHRLVVLEIEHDTIAHLRAYPL